MNKKTLSLTVLAALLSTHVFAANITISGVIPGSVTLHQVSTTTNGRSLVSAPVTTKYFDFEHVILSPEAKQYLADNAGKPAKAKMLMAVSNPAPLQANAGMNNVPVLDQGRHGTCATFATTAALDAVLGHTDHISQLCNLELGSTLAKSDRNYPSGWDGSSNEIILSQVKAYGIITQDYQKQYGCANVRSYPLNDENNTGHAMKVADFTKHSDKIMTSISWKTLLDMDASFSDQAQMETVLQNTKQAIATGHRVVIGTLIDEDASANGTQGSFKTANDSWVMSDIIVAHLKAKTIQAGHAMVIIAYDDNAVITDVDGKQHKGVVTLRNSWSSAAGDNGNYYMSYDYFTAMMMEVKEIVPSA